MNSDARTTRPSERRQLLRLILWSCFIVTVLPIPSEAQYKGDHIPGILGWSIKHADITAGYNLYIPTGKFSPTGTDNTGLGIWGNELTVGSTVHLDQKKLWNVAANFGLEFHTDKSGTNIQVGDLATIEG